jgi:hypothetical protein
MSAFRGRDFERTTRLISGLLDTQLSANERAQLEVLLETDSEARRLYLEMIDQELELTCRFMPVTENVACQTPVACDVVQRAVAEEKGAGVGSWWRRNLKIAAVLAVAGTIALWMRTRVSPWGDDARRMPSTWSADFEDGNARGWVGELTSDDLPSGSRFAIRAIRPDPIGAALTEIQMPANWQEGIFALSSSSTLNVSYRHTATHGWLNVFMHTSGADANVGQPSMFMLRPGHIPGPPGVWQTASIPFSGFVRKVIDPATGQLAFIGDAPRAGEVVFALSFSGSPNFDLVIDRIWVTHDSSGRDRLHTAP